MTTRKLFQPIMGMIAVATVTLVGADRIGACVTCTSDQDCETGGDWQSCSIQATPLALVEWFGSDVVCNMVGSCNDFALVTPASLSPAGTVLTDDTVVDVDGATELAGCSDNVVRHAPMQVSATGFAAGLAP